MTNKYYVYIHVKDGKVIYCGKGIKKIYNSGSLYDRAYASNGRKYDVTTVEVFKVKYFDNEQDAYAYEEFLTSWYKKCGQCEFNIDIANHHTDVTRQKMSENHVDMSGENAPWYGKTFSDEHRRKISESNKGEKNPMFGRTGVNNPTSIKVIAFTDSGSYYQEFACMHNAERELGVSSSHICNCVKGKRKSAGKYKGEKIRWKYKE